MIQKEMYATPGQKKSSNRRHNKEKENRIIFLNHEKIHTQIINDEHG
jgi:hypothetical protein